MTVSAVTIGLNGRPANETVKSSALVLTELALAMPLAVQIDEGG